MVVILNDRTPEYITHCTMVVILNDTAPEYIILYDGGDPKW